MYQPSLKRQKKAFMSTQAHTLENSNLNTTDFIDNKENEQFSLMNNIAYIESKRADHDRHFYNAKKTPMTYQEQKQFEQQQKKIQQWLYVKGDITDLVGFIIDQDLERDYDHTQNRAMHQNYKLNPFRICSGAAMDWHPVVLSLYKQAQKTSKQQKVHFVHGSLHEAGFLYYVIDKKLVLIKTSEYIQFRNRCQPSIFQIKEHIFAIKQVFLDNQHIPSRFKQTMLLFSQPWKVSLYGYQNKSNRVSLTFLDLTFNLLSPKVTVFDTSVANKIYYLDIKCQPNCLTIQDKFLGNFISLEKYRMKNYSKRMTLIENKLCFDRNWIGKSISYFFKNIWMTTRSIFPLSDVPITILSFAQKKIVVTLIMIEPSLLSSRFQKYVKLYSSQQDNLKSLGSVGESQFYQMISSSLSETKQNFKIKQIYKVGHEQHQKASLAILTNSLVRIYFELTQRGLKCCGVNKPPQSEAIAKELNRQPEIQQQKIIPSQQTPRELCCSIKLQRNYVLGTKIKHKNKLRLLLFGLFSTPQLNSKLHQNNCQVCPIQWSNFKQGFPIKIRDESEDIIGVPEQSNLYSQSKHLTAHPDIKDVIRNLCRNINNQYILNSFNPLKGAKDLILQTYFGPEQLIFCSQRKIGICIFLRPIDTIFTVIESSEDVEQAKFIIGKLLVDISQVDVISCLIQILSDPYGIYYLSKKLKKAIVISIERLRIKKNTKYINQILTSIVSKDQFQRVQALQSQYSKVFKSMIKSSKVYFIKQLIKHYSDSIQPHQHLNQLARQERLNQERMQALGDQRFQLSQQNKGRKGIYDGVIRCFSRIILIIWEFKVQKIEIQLIKVLRNKIQGLLKYLSELMIDISFGPKRSLDMFSHIKKFIAINVEYLNLLEILFKKPDTKYHDFINWESKRTDELIFRTFITGLRSEVFNEWNERFPHIFTKQSKRILKLYSIMKLKNSKEILEILREENPLPKYFIDYLIRARNVSQSQLLEITQTYQKPKQ